MQGGKSFQPNKLLALLLIFTFSLIYKQTVWDPYFAPDKQRPDINSAQEGSAGAGSAEQGLRAPAGVSSSKPELIRPEGVVAAPGAPKGQTTAAPVPQVAPQQSLSEDLIQEQGTLLVKTEKFEAEISLLGGRLKTFSLRDYREAAAENSGMLDLIAAPPQANYPLGVISGQSSDLYSIYALAATEGLLKQGNSQKKTFKLRAERGELELLGKLPDGRTIKKQFVFYPESYILDINLTLSAPAPNASPLILEFPKTVDKDSRKYTDYSSGIAWFAAGSTSRKLYNGISSGKEILSGVNWLAFSDKYFAEAIFRRPAELTEVKTSIPFSASISRPGNPLNYYLRAEGGDISAQFSLYLGPKNYNALREVGYDLHRTIDLGWSSVIAVPLLDLLQFFYKIFGNYGLAIIALTIVVKTALYPLTATGHRSMKAMQDLAPQMKRIQEEVTDKQEQQRQIMALYQKNKVNPLGGCFPLVLQMPIFIGLYYGLLSSIDLRHAPFCFWIKDLSAPEKLMIAGVPIPLMVILMVITMLIVQWTTPTTATPSQKRVMLVIPLVMGFFFATFPAGLTLYFLVNNLISIGQTKGLQSDGGKHPLIITGLVSLAMLALAAVLVFFGN